VHGELLQPKENGQRVQSGANMHKTNPVVNFSGLVGRITIYEMRLWIQVFCTD